MPTASASAQTAPAIPAASGPAPWKTVWLDHLNYQCVDHEAAAAFYDHAALEKEQERRGNL